MNEIPRTEINTHPDYFEVCLFEKNYDYPFTRFLTPILVLIALMIKLIFTLEPAFLISPTSGILLLAYLLSYKIKGKQIIIINREELSINSIWFSKKTSKYPIDFIEKFELDTGNKSSENLIFFYYLDDEIHFGLDIPVKPAGAIIKLLNEELIRLKDSRTEEYLSDQEEK